ncbi:MAG TPA: murein transglycosylase, partial [Rhodovulum sp.]|nr:murein transglycosylase [Rhodovulum sp.]
MRISAFALALAALCLAGPATATPCGDSAEGFDAWKRDFAREAASAGVGQRGLAALAATQYAQATINADRNQRSFRLSYPEFCRKRGCDAIVQ